MPTAQSSDVQDVSVLAELEAGLSGFSERWLADAPELDAFFSSWDQAWNTHDIDLVGTLVSENIVCEDPAMFGQRVENREEFKAFLEHLFRAFPDASFKATGELYLSLESQGVALPWRMTGTFSGELSSWSKIPNSQPHVTPPNGKAFDIEGVDLYRFRDGLLCDYRIVYDLLQFSAQVGLLG
jgi:steroid delta-isomerase-like uncharacterized protein